MIDYCRNKLEVAGVVLFLVLILSVIPVFAQLPTATILGTVKDTSGAVVPGAMVTAKNLGTGATRTVNTDSDGSYRISALPVGNYEVDIEHEGFSKEVRTGLTLVVDQNAVVNVALKIGQTQQTVQVTEEAPQVETTSSTLGGMVTEQKIEELPLNGRDFLSLTSLQPGVASVGSTEGQVRGLGGDIFVINGATMRSNNFMLDGAITQNAYGMNSQAVAKTSLGSDGVQEYKTITDLFTAEYGLTMGGQITMVSKGGGNKFHGDVYEFLRNNDLDAKNFFDVKNPHFTRNQFGGAFGGPIKKDKVFFWGVYEGLRQIRGLTINDTVPDAGCHGAAGQKVWDGTGIQPGGSVGPCPQLVAGRSNVAACAGVSPYGVAAPFGAGGATCVNADGVAPGSNYVTVANVVVPLLGVLPAPNAPSLGVHQFTFPAAETTQVDYGQMRVDIHFRDADTFFGRYTISEAAYAKPVTYPTVHDTQSAPAHFFTLSETHIFSPTLGNTVRASYSRTNVIATSQSSLTSPSFVSGQPTGGFTPGSGTTGYGPEPIHGFILQNIYTVSDDVFWNKGKNSFKFGTLLNFYGQAIDQGFFSYGTVGFSLLPNFLQGIYRSTSFTPGSATENRYYRYQTVGFYAQDDIRVTSRFTANVGLRYEFNTTPIEMQGKQAAFHNLTDAQTTPGPVVSNPSLKSFGPRVGFAWDIFGNGKTALRGGAGIFYDIANVGSMLQQDAAGTPPLSYQGGERVSQGNALALRLPVDLPPHPVNPCPPCYGVTLSTTLFGIQQPTNYQWSMTLERQLPFDMALGVSYVGSHSIHLWSDPEGNYALPAAIINGQPFWPDPALGDPAAPNAYPACTGKITLPVGANPADCSRLNPLYSDNSLFLTRGDGWYHALEVSVTKRVTHGLTFQSSYTFSKNLDTPSGQTANQDLQTFNSSDPINPFTDKGPDELNLTHVWKFNMLYHMPAIVKSNGLMSKLVNGWWTGSIITVQSGFNFSPTFASSGNYDLNNQSDRPDIVTAANVAAVRAGTYTRNGVLGGANPNAVPYDPNTVITGDLTPVLNNSAAACAAIQQVAPCYTQYGWFNPNMFVTPPPGFLGNASRGMLVGPPLSTWDFSVTKDTKLGFLGEGGNLQFRAEFFNLLNHPNFTLPTGSDSTYGGNPTFSGPCNPLVGCGAAVVSGSSPLNPTAGFIGTTGTLTPRQIQFGIRVEF